MPDSTVPYTLDLLNKNTTMTKLPNFLSSCKTNTNAAKPDSVFLATSPACAPSQSVSLLAPEAQLRESEWHTSVLSPLPRFIYLFISSPSSSAFLGWKARGESSPRSRVWGDELLGSDTCRDQNGFCCPGASPCLDTSKG